MTQAPAIDPEFLERLRRGVPLRLTADGRLLFDGEPVTHPRIEQALREGLDVSETGEPIVYLGHQWCYLHVDDCVLRAEAVRVENSPPDGREAKSTLVVRLDDGRELPIELASLWEEEGKGVRGTVPARKSGRALSVRFGGNAMMDLGELLVEDGDEMALQIGDHRHVIPQRPRIG